MLDRYVQQLTMYRLNIKSDNNLMSDGLRTNDFHCHYVDVLYVYEYRSATPVSCRPE